jgi:hypothetical protein
MVEAEVPVIPATENTVSPSLAFTIKPKLKHLELLQGLIIFGSDH